MAEVTSNYEFSNSIKSIPELKLSAVTRKLYKVYRDSLMITQKDLQALSNAIFADLGLRAVIVTFEGRRPHTNNGRRITRQVYGVHRSAMLSQSIQVYKYTAAKQKLVSAKSAISTLIHEINHNIDYNVLNMSKSIHSKGFYLRLKCLESALSA